jgi:nicotinamide-nucleotide amidase
MMQAEVIAIGDELTSGQRLDTNSQWLSQQLGYLGIPVARHVTVGDQLHVNVSALRDAAARSQVVILSGGLGPTLDDLTREALAEAFELPLVLDIDSLAHIEQLFARRGRPMPERNRVQAMFPLGTIPIPNPHGSAPGIDLTVNSEGNRCRFFALPGVPAEMKQMWEATVQPRLDAMLGPDRGSLFYQSVKLFGMGESDVEARVPNLIARDRYPTVGITVSQATITLRVAARAKSRPEFEQLIDPTLQEIRENLGELIFGYGEVEIFDALLSGLIDAKQSLAVLEIGAGSWITEAMQAATGYNSGSQTDCEEVGLRSDRRLSPGIAFLGGLALPNMESAKRWLGVDAGFGTDEATIQSLLHQATRSVRERLGASIGLCVASYPSQSEITQSPAGKTFPITIGIDAPCILGDQFMTEHKNLGGHPEVLNPRIAKTAADLLRRLLINKRC